MTERVPKYTKTVRCFSDRTKDAHFETVEAAAKYANDLIRAGLHQVKIYPYSPPKRPVDYIAEEEWARRQEAQATDG